MKTLTINKAVQKALKLAEYNERGRLLLSAGKIRGYLVETEQRLEDKNAEESAHIIIVAIANNTHNYEYAPGYVSFYG